jgi:mono/diheme cytochrome c family protein
MWKRSAVLLACAAATAGALCAQNLTLPPGRMQEKAKAVCLPCHDARIIVQQRMTRVQWAKDMDKMIRWGAPVEPGDREGLIDYFAKNFPATESAAASPVLAQAPGVEKVRAACLGCHDAGVIVGQRLDRRSWNMTINRQIRWGATVQPADREALLNYLATNYGPAKAARAKR